MSRIIYLKTGHIGRASQSVRLRHIIGMGEQEQHCIVRRKSDKMSILRLLKGQNK